MSWAWTWPPSPARGRRARSRSTTSTDAGPGPRRLPQRSRWSRRRWSRRRWKGTPRRSPVQHAPGGGPPAGRVDAVDPALLSHRQRGRRGAAEGTSKLNRQLQAGGQDRKVSDQRPDREGLRGPAAGQPGPERVLRQRQAPGASVQVHTGIAVAAGWRWAGGPGGPGFKPKKNITQVAREAGELIERARTGSLAPGNAVKTVGHRNSHVRDRPVHRRRHQSARGVHPGRARAASPSRWPPTTHEGDVADSPDPVDRPSGLLDGATGAEFLAQLKSTLEHPLQIVA